MEKYESNSHRSKELQREEAQSEKRVQKVVTGNVKTRKNEVRKFTDIFISEDAANVKSYIFMDVLVPAIKKAISDIVTDGVDMILYGEMLIIGIPIAFPTYSTVFARSSSFPNAYTSI